MSAIMRMSLDDDVNALDLNVEQGTSTARPMMVSVKAKREMLVEMYMTAKGYTNLNRLQIILKELKWYQKSS